MGLAALDWPDMVYHGLLAYPGVPPGGSMPIAKFCHYADTTHFLEMGANEALVVIPYGSEFFTDVTHFSDLEVVNTITSTPWGSDGSDITVTLGEVELAGRVGAEGVIDEFYPFEVGSPGGAWISSNHSPTVQYRNAREVLTSVAVLQITLPDNLDPQADWVNAPGFGGGYIAVRPVGGVVPARDLSSYNLEELEDFSGIITDSLATSFSNGAGWYPEHALPYLRHLAADFGQPWYDDGSRLESIYATIGTYSYQSNALFYEGLYGAYGEDRGTPPIWRFRIAFGLGSAPFYGITDISRLEIVNTLTTTPWGSDGSDIEAELLLGYMAKEFGREGAALVLGAPPSTGTPSEGEPVEDEVIHLGPETVNCLLKPGVKTVIPGSPWVPGTPALYHWRTLTATTPPASRYVDPAYGTMELQSVQTFTTVAPNTPQGFYLFYQGTYRSLQPYKAAVPATPPTPDRVTYDMRLGWTGRGTLIKQVARRSRTRFGASRKLVGAMVGIGDARWPASSAADFAVGFYIDAGKLYVMQDGVVSSNAPVASLESMSWLVLDVDADMGVAKLGTEEQINAGEGVQLSFTSPADLALHALMYSGGDIIWGATTGDWAVHRPGALPAMTSRAFASDGSVGSGVLVQPRGYIARVTGQGQQAGARNASQSAGLLGLVGRGHSYVGLREPVIPATPAEYYLARGQSHLPAVHGSASAQVWLQNGAIAQRVGRLSVPQGSALIRGSRLIVSHVGVLPSAMGRGTARIGLPAVEVPAPPRELFLAVGYGELPRVRGDGATTLGSRNPEPMVNPTQIAGWIPLTSNATSRLGSYAQGSSALQVVTGQGAMIDVQFGVQRKGALRVEGAAMALADPRAANHISSVTVTGTITAQLLVLIFSRDSARVLSAMTLRVDPHANHAEILRILSSAFVTLKDSQGNQDGGEVWVMNMSTGAFSRYEHFDFTSMAKIGEHYYGVREDGVYRLDGDSDAGQDINASLRTGKLELGSPSRKRLSAVYLDAASDSRLLLRVRVENMDYTYLARTSGTHRQQRVDPGRGLVGSYYDLELIAKGQDFECNGMDVALVANARRV
ncbi:hypothetical protein [Comamonas aquatica]|uniref:hypothetical protein n=1 Tax=Comamonas aquatica TaxID=225991 RepID=UPI0034D496B7